MSQENTPESINLMHVYLRYDTRITLPLDYNDKDYFDINDIKFILLAGKQRAGKTTAANDLVERLNKNHSNIYAERYALATELKDIVNDLSKLFGAEIGSMHDDENKVKYRKYLQTVGTDIFRNKVYEDIWSQLLFRNIITNALTSSKQEFLLKKAEKYNCIANDLKYYYVVIDDVRFQNEIDFFKKRFDDAYVIQIVREGVEGLENAEHCSEHQSLVVDEVIHNEENVKEFLDGVYDMVSAYVDKVNDGDRDMSGEIV